MFRSSSEIQLHSAQSVAGIGSASAPPAVSDSDLWSSIREVWSEDKDKAPTLVYPVTVNPLLRLDQHEWYPKSRALSRLGLRHALLQRLLIEGRIHFNYTFKRFELMSDNGRGVQLLFEGQDPHDADILIAADGSGSRVNQQIGINNKIKLQSQFVIHSRTFFHNLTSMSYPNRSSNTVLRYSWVAKILLDMSRFITTRIASVLAKKRQKQCSGRSLYPELMEKIC